MQRLITILFILFSGLVLSQEICNNGIDDDGDGLIDLNDPDCACDGFNNSSEIPSLIPNPSFEDRNCCPTSFSQLNCASTWIQATSATSDYFNCSYYAGAATAIGLTAHSGTGYVGAIYQSTWREYVGACLLAPLEANQEYTLQFSIASFAGNGYLAPCSGLTYGPIDVSVFGAQSCSSLPVNTTNCPTSANAAWQLIGSATYTPQGSWSTITISISPTVDINTIMIGPPCGNLPPGYAGSPCYAYFVYDDLILNANDQFNSISITEHGSFCAENVYLEASAEVLGGAWQWYQDGIAIVGETNSTLQISSNGLGAGNYQVRYVLNGDCDVAQHVLAPISYPVADFDVDEVCIGVATQFTDLSTSSSSTITSWSWDFTNDNIFDNTTQSPSHLFTTSGTKPVMLKVVDAEGCADSIVKNAIVNPGPAVDFTATEECFSNATEFTTTLGSGYSGDVATWAWDLGDGNTESVQNPTHTYSEDGTYSVEVIATSSEGCVGSQTHQIVVYPNPVANFSATEDCQGIITSFSDLSSVNNVNTHNVITNWSWNFDNSQTSSQQNPQVNYSSSGIYDVELTVTTDNGCTHSVTIPVSVYPNPVANFSVEGVCISTTSEFQDLSSVDNTNGDYISSWSWSFGDGHSSSSQNPTNTYSAESVYNALLSVVTNNGCTDEITLPVEVYPNPQPTFSATDVCETFTTSFINSSTVSNANTTNQIVTWDWNFTDGLNSSQQNPSHVFSAFGTYNVVLTATTNHGCSESISVPVTVHPLPTANFSGVNLEGCSELCPIISSTSTSVSPIVNYHWTLSNGQTLINNSGQFHPCFTLNAGDDLSLDLYLEVTTDKGCKDEEVKTNYIHVYHNPIADFIYEPTAPDVTNPVVEFINTSLYEDFSVWYFSDAASTVASNPIIEFPSEAGDYGATLIVSTIHNCVDTIYQPITINDVLIFYVPNTFTPDNDDYNEVFKPIFYSGIDLQSYKLSIFNRWGETLFESHNTEVGWDGTYGVNSNQLVKDGTYIWKIELKTTMNDEHKVYYGHVNLLK